MTNNNNTQAISRRSLLKVGIAGAAVLATAGVATSVFVHNQQSLAGGYQQLRAKDVPMLSTIISAILQGRTSAPVTQSQIDSTLQRLDRNIDRLSPNMLKQTLQLFDLLTLSASRGLVTGIWRPWERAEATQVQAFLKRWESSRFALFQQGYLALVKLTLMAWYSQPDAWAVCGYPGPPTI